MAINPDPFTGIPTPETLDEIAQLIAKCDFEDIVKPEERAIVIDLAIKLAIKAEQSGALQDIALWFRLSKVWEGN